MIQQRQVSHRKIVRETTQFVLAEAMKYERQPVVAFLTDRVNLLLDARGQAPVSINHIRKSLRNFRPRVVGRA